MRCLRWLSCFLLSAILLGLALAAPAHAQPAKVIVKKDVVYGSVHGAGMPSADAPKSEIWRASLNGSAPCPREGGTRSSVGSTSRKSAIDFTSAKQNHEQLDFQGQTIRLRILCIPVSRPS